jgi:hypothetical protein
LHESTVTARRSVMLFSVMSGVPIIEKSLFFVILALSSTNQLSFHAISGYFQDSYDTPCSVRV